MSTTIDQVVDDAQNIIGDVAGPGVQTYSQDRMRDDCRRAFNLLFKKAYWPQYSKWFPGLQVVKDFEDFNRIHRIRQRISLGKMPKQLNPSTVLGNTARYWTSLFNSDANYAKRKLQFYPQTSVGQVDILARIYPTEPFTGDTVLFLDRDLLAYGVAYMTLSMDGLNPDAAQVCKGLMEMTFKDIMASMATQEFIIAGNNLPMYWTTSGDFSSEFSGDFNT